MFKPLFWLFRVGGLYPNRSKADGYFTVGALVLALGTAPTVVSTVTNISLDSFLRTMVLVSIPSFCFAYTGQILTAHFRKPLFLSIMDQLSSAENGGRRPTGLGIMAFLLFALTWFFKIVMGFGLGQNILYALLYQIGTSLVTLVVLQYVVIVGGIEGRLTTLNNNLRAVAARAGDTPLGRLRKEVRILFREHAALRQLVRDVNSYFALSNICGYFARVINIVSRAYIILTAIHGRDTVQLHVALTMFGSVVLVIIMVEGCHRCSYQANQTVMIAHRMLDENSPIELMEDVELFSLAQFNNPVTFTAAGVFNFNRGFITKVCAASLSYLTVAMQLRNVHPPPQVHNNETLLASSNSTSFA